MDNSLRERYQVKIQNDYHSRCDKMYRWSNVICAVYIVAKRVTGHRSTKGKTNGYIWICMSVRACTRVCLYEEKIFLSKKRTRYRKYTNVN